MIVTLLNLQGATVECGRCSTPVDPLRAPKVAIRSERFRYYCSVACWDLRQQTHLGSDLQNHSSDSRVDVHDSPSALLIEAPDEPTDALESSIVDSDTSGREADDTESQELTVRALAPLVEFVGEPTMDQVLEMLGIDGEKPAIVRREHAASMVGARRVLHTQTENKDELVVLVAAFVVAILSGAVLWLGGWIALIGTALMAVVAVGLGAHSLWQLRERLLWICCAPPMLGAGCALLRAITHHRTATSLALAASVSVGTAIAAFAVRRAMRHSHEQLLSQRDTLPRTARVGGGKVMEVHSIRAGEEVFVESGECVGVDGVVREGKAQVITPSGVRDVHVGQPILAGTVLRTGALTILATRAGDDVAMMRVATVAESTQQHALTSTRAIFLSVGSVVAAVLFAGVISTGYHARDFLTCAALALGALPMTLALALARVPWEFAIVAGIGRGVLFRDQESLAQAAQIRALVLCVKQTLTRGEYELVEIVSLGKFDERSLLALAAGAESAAPEPLVNGAFVRAAEQRKLKAELIRRPVVTPGRGVVAATATGVQVLLGTRALFIAESVAVASAEEVARSIEAQGRHVLFLALNGVVEGVFGLDDPPREEARAAVQQLMDNGVSVALVGGESSGTLAALGLSIDVGHIRAEVAVEDRAAAVRSIAEVAGRVAVAGRTPLDDGALGAADLSIAVEAAGGSGAETAVALTGDDLRDVVQCLLVARVAQKQADQVLLVSVAAAIVAMVGALLAPTLSLAVLVLWVASAVGAAIALRTVEDW